MDEVRAAMGLRSDVGVAAMSDVEQPDNPPPPAAPPAAPPAGPALTWRSCFGDGQAGALRGPLDLLLHLIKRDEIDIYDIPIAHITQQYLTYIELMRSLDLEVAGEFLVMAATLMRIKAKMLLPLPGPGEPEDEGDPREELVQRLVEYRQFKEAAGTLKLREEERRQLYERGMLPGEEEAGPLPLASATLFDLLDALNRVMLARAGADGLRSTGRDLRRRGQDRDDRPVRRRGRHGLVQTHSC
jgi:hypothetical protein